MTQHFNKALKFRESFRVVDKELLHWFPGHMGKGMRQMQQKLKMVDLIIEVHDARIPFSGRNPQFYSTITAIRPHILVLNKKDLTDTSQKSKVLEMLKEQKLYNVIYTDCRSQKCPGVKQIFPLMEQLIEESDRYNRSNIAEHNVMIIGVPNVGKSSLINVLRNIHLKRGNASPVGGRPGITRNLLNRIKISEEPQVYMFDTPGILTPSVDNIEMGLKLALCNCLLDHLVGEDVIADYLLYWLNKHEKYKYVELMGLKGPTDDILEVLTVGAIKLKKIIHIKQFDCTLKAYPDLNSAAKHMIEAFRTGQLGSIFLDRDLLKEHNENMQLSQIK